MVASLTAQYVAARAARGGAFLARLARRDRNLRHWQPKSEDRRREDDRNRPAPRAGAAPLRGEPVLHGLRQFHLSQSDRRDSARQVLQAARPWAARAICAQAIYAQRNAVFRGGEFQSQLDVAPLAGGTVGVENQGDIVRASFTGGGNVPRIPPARLGGGLFWRDANWLARINLLHAFSQNNIAATGETPTKGYDQLKAELCYRYDVRPRRSARSRNDASASRPTISSTRTSATASPSARMRYCCPAGI